MSQTEHLIRYRPEIDGLRALSVLSVLFFHAEVPGFSGGFWGVDVFFVISGYLITRLLLVRHQAGRLNLADFYLRRARRILPALYLVLLCSAVSAWFLLIPTALLEFCSTLAGATLFYSNVVFWKQNGYFAQVNELKPLIHTWSLAIEEQFYLLWPLLLIIVTRLAQRKRLPLICLLLASSFIVAAVLSHFRPGATFFLPFGRAWELLAGAAIAWIELAPDPADTRHRQAELASMTGLLILVLTLTIGTGSNGPGTPALPAIAGTVLLLRFANESTLAARLLAARPLVLVGLCSYSIYLWHYPVFAFARHLLIDAPDGLTLYGLAGGSVVLGFLSWRYLEKPFRDPVQVPTRVFLPVVALGTIGLLAFAVAGHRTKGFETAYLDRLDPAQQSVYRSLSKLNYPIGTTHCRFSSARFDKGTEKRLTDCFARLGPAFVILGDSHGQNLYRSLLGNSEHPFVVSLSSGGCRPHNLSEQCPYERFMKFAHTHSAMIRTVIYTQAGFYLLKDSQSRPATRRTLAATSVETWTPNEDAIAIPERYLTQLAQSRIPVLWLGAPIEPHLSGERLRKLAMRCDLSQARIKPGVREGYLALDRALALRPLAEKGITYVSQVEALQFDERRDLYTCRAVYWRDGDHWSPAGERYFGARIVDALSKLYVVADLKANAESNGNRPKPE
ncbi:acyltransferase [Solimonas sp. K1W22B-7]|uniref:acyltransferase family protein n=1 Tax=Solimonas sp. K1W22B-7 TaxID=2303331 RepID=UPI000E33738F|nr:acyltransferase family protein [Solimonas sp. K1W22B-7]AXQ29514.1 acyltransferase [Solimonas sp. K1W22B-7]